MRRIFDYTLQPTPKRGWASRVTILALLTGLHVIAYGLFQRSAIPLVSRRQAPVVMTTIHLRPTIREDDGRPLDALLTQLTIAIDTPLQYLQLDSHVIDVSVPRNGNARVSAPSLLGGAPVDMTPFVQQATLGPGEGATVVLRVEVLDTGDPGQILVEVSSGSRVIDDAAIAYARANRWYAGRADGTPQIMWIRWGVRLQA